MRGACDCSPGRETMRAPMPASMDRPLAQRRAHLSPATLLVRVGLVTALVAIVALLVSRVDFRHDLHRMHVNVLSGAAQGAYHATVDALSATAAARQGTIATV